jgi:hypothetical protein
MNAQFRASDLGPADNREDRAWQATFDSITEDVEASEWVGKKLAESHADLIARLADAGVSGKWLDSALTDLRKAAALLWREAATRAYNREHDHV